MSRVPDEARIVEMLRRLGREMPVPDIDPQRERALLAGFDASKLQPRSSAPVWRVFAGTVLAIAATLALIVAYRGGHAPAMDHEAIARDGGSLSATDFVLWPGAAELPTFESGHLMRVQMPASVATELGLTPTLSADSVTRADILVGQDGLPRAVRLVNDF